MMHFKKEEALADWLEMIKQSWTWKAMTEEERETCENAIDWFARQKMLKGTYKERWQLLNGAYHMFIEGLGDIESGWRA